MSVRTISFSLLLSVIFISFPTTKNLAVASDGVTLYTPYTKISVPPGQSINYSIDVINNTNETKSIDFYLSGLPKSWSHDLKSGGWDVEQLTIRPKGKETLKLRVDVPLKVNKGDYQFKVVAKNYSVLPLKVNVSEQGTFKTEFTCDQMNMQGNSKSTFAFRAKLKNSTGDKQLYSLRADVERGWNVTFKPDGKQATSVEIDANNTKNVSIEVKAPEIIQAGTYKIPVSATTSSTSAEMELEVVITGTYEMELTTPTGRLSESITAGDNKRVELMIKNTGSSELKDIKLTTASPNKWDVVFDPKQVDRLGAGENTHIYATIKPDRKAIAGDYAIAITAKTPEVSSKADFRISVKTPMLWGWVGIFIILIALGSVYYLFRKYGRR